MALRKIIFWVIGLTMGLFASAECELGLDYYENKKYKEAFPIILKAARRGVNKTAQYRLAEMYEKGLGTEVDYEKSIYWYKKAASKYSYSQKKKTFDANSSLLQRLNSQLISNDNMKAGNEYALSKLDTDTPETESFLTSFLDGNFFGLKPHEANYFLPISYSKDKPNRVDSLYGHNGLPANHNEYDNNTEAVFQFSIRKDLFYNLFGFNEFFTAAYTQKVWWQLYGESAPFREINAQAELFVTIPTSQNIDHASGLKAVKFGYLHESNGQEGYRSRSWNRLYATGVWQWGNLFLSTRAWYRLKENRNPDWYYEQSIYDAQLIQRYGSGDDNPDIEDYIGNGDIQISYLYGKSQFGLLLRNNLHIDENKGAVEFTYSYPFFSSPNTFWYTKVFTGYGESLIDYNVDVTKASFGFSFSRGIF